MDYYDGNGKKISEKEFNAMQEEVEAVMNAKMKAVEAYRTERQNKLIELEKGLIMGTISPEQRAELAELKFGKDEKAMQQT
jgi:hypothetical protein